MKAFSKLFSLLAASVLSVSALAQSGGLPPVQTPAGDPGKLQRPKLTKQPVKSDALPDAATPTVPADKAPTDKRSARKAKRAEKVGDKPLD